VSDFTLPEEVVSEAGIRQKSATVQSICNRHEEVIALAKLKSKELGRIIEFIPKQNTLLMRRKIYNNG
jgi:hypothetical protein